MAASQIMIFRPLAQASERVTTFIYVEMVTSKEERQEPVGPETTTVDALEASQEYPVEPEPAFSSNPEPISYKRFPRDAVIRRSSPAQPQRVDELAGVLLRDFSGLHAFSVEEVEKSFDRMRKRR